MNGSSPILIRSGSPQSASQPYRNVNLEDPWLNVCTLRLGWNLWTTLPPQPATSEHNDMTLMPSIWGFSPRTFCPTKVTPNSKVKSRRLGQRGSSGLMHGEKMPVPKICYSSAIHVKLIAGQVQGTLTISIRVCVTTTTTRLKLYCFLASAADAAVGLAHNLASFSSEVFDSFFSFWLLGGNSIALKNRPKIGQKIAQEFNWKG